MSTNDDLSQLALRLRSIARDDGSIDAAQVRLIGLDEIRQAAGAKWPRMRARVQTGSLNILSRFTGPEDVVIPAGDGFLVVLGKGAPGNNQDRCRKMREALLTFYLGEEALQTLRPEVNARSLSADGFADLIASNLSAEGGLPAQDALLRNDITEARVFSTRERRVVGRWFCPVRRDQTGSRPAYDCEYILDGLHHGRSFADMDMAILDHAQRCAVEEEGERLAIGFTVHASTMQSRRSRELFLAALGAASPAFKARSLITIAEVERGTPLMSLAEWCCGLRISVNRISIELHYTDHAIASIGSTGAWAAGFHLPIYSGAQKGPRATRTLEQIRFWSKSLKAQGLRLAINGFQEPEFVEQARAAGVDIATSNVLWPFTPAATKQNSGTHTPVHADVQRGEWTRADVRLEVRPG